MLFSKENQVLHLCKGAHKEDTTDRDSTEKENEAKSPTAGGIQTHKLSVMRHVLYSCATTPALIILTWMIKIAADSNETFKSRDFPSVRFDIVRC